MQKIEQTFGKYRLGKTLGKGYQAKVFIIFLNDLLSQFYSFQCNLRLKYATPLIIRCMQSRYSSALTLKKKIRKL